MMGRREAEEARAKMEEGFRYLFRAARSGELSEEEFANHVATAVVRGLRTIASDVEVREGDEG
jgi:hypothetical protein